MTTAQVAFLAAFTLLLVILLAATAGIVAAVARPAGPTGRHGLLCALGLSPALPAATTRWAHYLHRLTGIGITAFLALNIADVSLLAFLAPADNRVHQLYGTPALRLFECAPRPRRAVPHSQRPAAHPHRRRRPRPARYPPRPVGRRRAHPAGRPARQRPDHGTRPMISPEPATSPAPEAGQPETPAAGQRAAAGRSWLLIRVTGLLLSVLVLGHLLAVHLLTDVAHTTSSYVLRRWSAALWTGWDGTMLTAALAHGAAGLSAILRDHTRPGPRHRAATAALLLITLALAGLGWYTITAVQHALAAQ